MNVVNNDVTRQKKATNQEKIWRMRRDFKLMDNCSRPQEEESHIRVQHTKLSRQRKKEPKIARDNIKDFERFKTEDLSRKWWETWLKTTSIRFVALHIDSCKVLLTCKMYTTQNKKKIAAKIQIVNKQLTFQALHIV